MTPLDTILLTLFASGASAIISWAITSDRHGSKIHELEMKLLAEQRTSMRQTIQFYRDVQEHREDGRRLGYQEGVEDMRRKMFQFLEDNK